MKRSRIESCVEDGFAHPSYVKQRKAAGGVLTAKQAPPRPGLAPALGLRAGLVILA